MKVDILLIDSATACPCSCFTPHLIEKGYIVDRRQERYSLMDALTDEEQEYSMVIVHETVLTWSLRTVRKIRAHHSTIPIIVITYINRGPTDVDAVFKAGANEIVVKPMCGPGYLVEMIEKHLQRKQ